MDKTNSFGVPLTVLFIDIYRTWRCFWPSEPSSGISALALTLILKIKGGGESLWPPFCFISPALWCSPENVSDPFITVLFCKCPDTPPGGRLGEVSCLNKWLTNLQPELNLQLQFFCGKKPSDVILFDWEVADHVPAGWNRKCYHLPLKNRHKSIGSVRLWRLLLFLDQQNHELQMSPSQNVKSVKKWQAERFQSICFHLETAVGETHQRPRTQGSFPSTRD